MVEPIDILILSNGPGEVATWVRPVVRSLRQQFAAQARISLVLSPCPNATGREVAIAQTFPELDRIQGAAHFLPFLLTGKTAENWDWHDRGVVLFLGGDQFFSVVIGKRLGYRIVVYGEWETRWHRWVDRFGVMKPQLIDRAPAKYRDRLSVVGDLMAEVGVGCRDGIVEPVDRPVLVSASTVNQPQPPTTLIGLLPGSKAAKLTQGVPLALAIAQQIYAACPQVRFVLPVAPTLDLPTLAKFADPMFNPILADLPEGAADLAIADEQAYLKTASGLQVELVRQFPAYDTLAQCQFCLTTVGANTAELGSLAVPMIVLLPTYQLDAMRSWDGLPGLLARLPGAGKMFAKLINGWFLRRSRLLAWPNIWAGEAIVPELIGKLQPEQVALLAIDWLHHPEKLAAIRQRLRQVRGTPGAADQLVAIVTEVVAD
ncbi:lipid-A-disaccharide synthase [Leptolyngbya sp. FACHB-1515]